MSSSGIRRKQRLSNYNKVYKQLDDACQFSEYNYLEVAGLLDFFEFTFELARKTLKDLLYYEEHEDKSQRSVVRRSFEVGYISESEAEFFLDGLQKRNLLTHKEGIDEEAVELTNNSYYPAPSKLYSMLNEKS